MPHFPSWILLLVEQTPHGGWQPGIGDPTLLGWLTVLAYFGTAWLCLRACRSNLEVEPRDRRVVLSWRALAILMIMLGLNKQLDLQSLITVVGRQIAKRDGWYEARQDVQLWFIRLVCMGGGGLLLLGVWWIRHHLRELGLAYIGACFIVVFVVVRATSFHRVDIFLASELGELRMNWILEIGGIGLIALGAGLCRRR